MKKLTLASVALGILILNPSPAQAVPLVINTEVNGQCLFVGDNENFYIYECRNGALEYVRKSNPGNGGGGNGDGDNGGGDPIDG